MDEMYKEIIECSLVIGLIVVVVIFAAGLPKNKYEE